jgi:hypothetical protein
MNATTDFTLEMRHFLTSIVAVAVRPKISGSYISSACAGAVRKVPAVVARAM